jgi:MFS family permease
MERGFWKLLVVLTVVLYGSLRLERALDDHYILELYLLMLAVVIGIFCMLGIAMRKDWAWPLSTILLALLTLNAMVLFISTRAGLLLFGVVMCLCLIGMILSIMRTTSDDSVMDALESLPRIEFTKGNSKN